MMYFDEHKLASTENIIFFDIDGTFSSSNEVLLYRDNQKYIEFKQSYYQNWETIKLVDYQFVNHTCIALFANLLRQTNSKAVCVSSWNMKGRNKPELYLKQLEEAFQAIYSDFPNDWFLGFSGSGGGDRTTYSINPFLEETGFKGKYIAIDDGGFEYADQSYVVQVISRNGFNHNDYQKALQLFGINEDVTFF